MSLKAAVVVVLFLCCADDCACYSNGSVASACGSMIPFHPPFTPSMESPPYVVATSSVSYRPGGVITVTLKMAPQNSTVFQGFLLQARAQLGQELLWPIGRFININTSAFNALNCNNMENSTVSQASADPKINIQLTWEAPSTSNYGEIYFSATLVQDYTKFWTEVRSDTLTLESNGNTIAGHRDLAAFIFCLAVWLLTELQRW